MPKKGEKGMSQADKDAATAELKQACESFAAELAKRQDKSPDRKLLEKHFTQKQLQSLWKRLEAKRGVAPQNVKEAWDALKEYGSEGRQAKWAALGDFALAAEVLFRGAAHACDCLQFVLFQEAQHPGGQVGAVESSST